MTTFEGASAQSTFLGPAAPALPQGLVRLRSTRSTIDAAPASRRYRRRLVITDTALILLTTAAALPLIAGGPLAARTLIFGSLLVLAWSLALEGYRTRDARVIGSGSSEYKRAAHATVLTFGLGAMAAIVTGVPQAQVYYVATLPLGLTTLVLSRWLWRKWLFGRRARGEYRSRALVVGRLEDVARVVQCLDRTPYTPYSVVGVMLDDSDLPTLAVGARAIVAVDNSESVTSNVRLVDADTVIVAGARPGDARPLRELGWELEDAPADLVIASGLADVAGPRIHFRPVEGMQLLHVDLPHFAGGKHLLKRGLDLTAAAISLALLAPLMLAIAVLVKLDSPGPALFRQERVGRNGRLFTMYKFRSMRVTAEEDLAALLARNEGAGVLFKMKDDPRITRLGRFLRKYSLDELPQVWNILVGDMSLVGPRPPLQREVDAYEHHVHRRLFIKPGLTGLWQVSGRSDLSWEESVRLDLYYVENWSLTGDLMIIWRTARVMLRPAGAY